ncbi:hypothetical protein HMPREF9004_0542 [Schaalia cardiffensis F0333]|uniref:Uncharacterized protein n=1 Tax=Schaalia cardiffensis F0333 TaxID=888050 RepID=N6X672_9ACTO|nr:hypothetical protein HMPREF9004_0542 [Schaalia cardiffensis F0333]
MKKRTYEKTPGQKKWWWTHKELRAARSLPRTLVKDEQLSP